MKPANIRIVVDLPAPLGPRKPSTSPRDTLNEMSSTAVKAPKRLVSPAISIRSRLALSGHAAPPHGPCWAAEIPELPGIASWACPGGEALT